MCRVSVLRLTQDVKSVFLTATVLSLCFVVVFILGVTRSSRSRREGLVKSSLLINRAEELRSREGVRRLEVQSSWYSTVNGMVTGSVMEPIRDVLYNVNGSNSDRAVFVVPRRAYYDNRLEASKPQNGVVILAEAHDDAVDTILACELDGRLSHSVKVWKEDVGWIRYHYPVHTHLVLVIQCIGVPQEAIFNGSIARVVYKLNSESYYSRVQSEKPLFLSKLGSDPSAPVEGKGSIVVCTTLYGHPDRFDQWVKYHKYLGVERLHVQAHISFTNNIARYPFFSDSLRNGFARVEVWNDIVGDRTFYMSQKLKYQDCLYRHRGVFDYGLFYDCDDFFNPVVPDQKDIHYYFSKFFSNSKTGTVCMPWRQMECAPIQELVKDAPHGNLTAVLSGYKSELRPQAKCAHRLSAAVMVSVHTVTKLLEGYHKTYSQLELAYVAHNRKNMKQCTTGSGTRSR